MDRGAAFFYTDSTFAGLPDLCLEDLEVKPEARAPKYIAVDRVTIRSNIPPLYLSTTLSEIVVGSRVQSSTFRLLITGAS